MKTSAEFLDFLMEHLSAKEYDQLTYSVFEGSEKSRNTYLTADHERLADMPVRFLRRLVEVLKDVPGIDVADLIETYGLCSNKLTMSEADQLARTLGMKVGFITHAA